MRRCAFLTLSDPGDFVIDDALAYGPMEALGWSVTAVPWRQPGAPWSSFDAVVIRSTWDYQRDPEHFLEVLGEVTGLGVPLFNPLGMVRWNLAKDYLHDLARWGVPIVPTLALTKLEAGALAGLFDDLASEEVVVKPVVGANAEGAFRLHRGSWRGQAGQVEACYAEKALLAQPFLRAVVEEGEYSLFYLDGDFSHGVLKTPAPGDFRAQEEHGATIRPIRASGALLAAGNDAVAALPEKPLYARVDLARSNEGDGFLLLELELIEPSLYLRMDPAAPMRFAQAFCRRMAGQSPNARGPAPES